MYDYAEACPISKAASVLCERWTLQIIREMFMGATRFSEFQRYLPRMSPALLNTRLRALEAQGIILKKRVPEKKGFEYHLTPAGNALKPVLGEIGKWGMNWVFLSMEGDQLNTSVIVRDFAFAMDTEQLPSGNSVLQFNVQSETENARKFIMVRDRKTEVCEENPGNEVDVYLSAELKTLYQIWYGEIPVNLACEQKLLKVVGPAVYANNLSRWLRTSQFAQHNRKAC